MRGPRASISAKGQSCGAPSNEYKLVLLNIEMVEAGLGDPILFLPERLAPSGIGQFLIGPEQRGAAVYPFQLPCFSRHAEFAADGR